MLQSSVIMFDDVAGSSNGYNDPGGRDYQDEEAHQWTVCEAHEAAIRTNR